jgi:hypothetical protein
MPQPVHQPIRPRQSIQILVRSAGSIATCTARPGEQTIAVLDGDVWPVCVEG